jgi:HEAT repeat protein
MNSMPASRPGQNAPSLVRIAVRLGILLLPAALLLGGSLLTAEERSHFALLLGAIVAILVAGVIALRQGSWRQPLGLLIIALYLLALGWFWVGTSSGNAWDADLAWYPHLAGALLLLVPLLIFTVQVIRGSGNPILRRAHTLAQRLTERKNWPTNLGDCRTLPEVKALREAVQTDMTPALALLHHSRPEVRVAALAALEFRKDWQPSQLAPILQLAQSAPEPAVRAAAISALGNVDDRQLVEAVAELLRDPALEVRRASAEALLWDTERRWAWIRHAVRRALADPALHEDDPLTYSGQLLSPDAVTDLTAWAAERGQVAGRAARALGVHYTRALSDRTDANLIQGLKQQLADPHTPVALRMELARLLQARQALEPALLESLLGPANPAPIRLIAVESLLAIADHPEAVATLRDIARLPNREIALTTADVIQRRLGVDLGLALGQPLPPVQSREAAEVTRRVMTWAAGPQEPHPQGP